VFALESGGGEEELAISSIEIELQYIEINILKNLQKSGPFYTFKIT
jgi:hypothetical protein